MDWNVAGHEWAAHLLQQHIARGEARHAYLFAGPPGVGRRTLALRFAQALNCTQPPAPGMPCGECITCKQIERMQHADLSVVQAENAGGTLKVDQIRDLLHTLSLAPYSARYRVALLLRFEEAHPSAQNALLKTLEEAPPRAVLLLTAESSEAVLPTIASRCEVLRLRPMRIPELEGLLHTRWKLKPDEAKRLAHLSQGRVGYALQLHEHTAELEKRGDWIAELLQTLQSNRRQRLHYAERIAKDRDTLRQALQVWLSFWRDLLVCAIGSDLPLINLEFESDLRALAGRISPKDVSACIRDLEQAILRLDGNANARLLTEVLLMDWPSAR